MQRAVIITLFSMLFLLVHTVGLAQNLTLRQYIYRFENPKFEISLVEITISETGDSTLRFKKRDEDDETLLSIKLSATTIQKLQTLYDELRFLDSTETYQSSAQLSNLGTTTLGLKHGERNRSASFSYTTNASARELAAFYRAIENQYRRVEELKLARQFTPLDLPKQLKNLEEELKRNRIAEPLQLVTTLSDISVDDNAPLIARNLAGKLVSQIKKGK